MKKIYIIVAAISALMMSSCDLERLPYDAYTPEKINEDPVAAFEILYNGCYSIMKEWGDNMHRIGEYPSDNIMIRGASSDSFYPFITYGHIPDNGRLTSFWNYSYKLIAQSSNLINANETGVSTERDQKLGELYYLRGLNYFYLCRIFGRPYYQNPESNMGVPIVLDGIPTNTSKLDLPDRSSVKDTYAQAIRDLRKAESLMTVDKSAGYASKEAAQAMLSRIYLYMSGTYSSPNTMYADSAIYYANQVITSGRYSLLSRENFMNYNKLAPDANGQTETIFAVKRIATEYSGSDYYYNIGGMYATILGMGWGEMYASAKYLDLLRKAGKKNDARWAFIDPQYETNKAGEKTPSFRFIADLKNEAGTQTGYKYVQDTLEYKSDGTPFTNIAGKEYLLTLVDAGENMYSISYEGKTYTGYTDYMMLLNRTFPMFYVTKCSLQDGEAHLHSPIVSRLAELYLNMAEAYAKKGDYANALTNLNTVRERSIVGGSYTSLNSSNAEQLISEERQLEMAFEADRSYDVYRLGQTMTRHYPGPHDAMEDISADHLRVVHFIPLKEINAYTTKLTQNP